MLSRTFRTFAGLAVLFLLATALPNAAQAQRVDWRGTAYLDSFTAACAVNGWTTPQLRSVRFRPQGLPSGGNWSGIAFYDQFSAFALYLQGARFGRTWADVAAGDIAVAPHDWGAGVQIRVTRQTPNNANLDETTPVVRMVGQIRNFDGIAHCTASFDATMLLRR